MIYDKRGKIVRLIYLLMAMFFYPIAILRRLRVSSSIVLCYHGIRTEQVDMFRWQMAKVSSKQGVSSGGREFQKIIITFDDAFENLLQNAVPVLEELQVDALIFAVADNLGTTPQWQIPVEHSEYHERTMTAEQLMSLGRNRLIRIGSHTLTHPRLADLSSQAIKYELCQSKEQLEKILEHPIEDLALPHGSFNRDVLAIAEKAGYKRVYTLEPVLYDLDSKEYAIGRFSMSPNVWKIEFILTCAGAYTWLWPWRQFLGKIKDLFHR